MQRTEIEHLGQPDAAAWDGLRRPVRDRLARACRHLLDAGTLRRADIMRESEVSIAQAAIDLRTIRERCPELLDYDASAKHYFIKGKRAS